MPQTATNGVWIAILGNDDIDRRSRVNSYGAVLSTDRTTYDPLGRVTKTQRTTGAEVTLKSSGDTELTIAGTRSRVTLSLTTAGRVATIHPCPTTRRFAPLCPMFA